MSSQDNQSVTIKARDGTSNARAIFSKTPAQVKYEDAKSAIEIPGRMHDFVRFMLNRNGAADYEYQKIGCVQETANWPFSLLSG